MSDNFVCKHDTVYHSTEDVIARIKKMLPNSTDSSAWNEALLSQQRPNSWFPINWMACYCLYRALCLRQIRTTLMRHLKFDIYVTVSSTGWAWYAILKDLSSILTASCFYRESDLGPDKSFFVPLPLLPAFLLPGLSFPHQLTFLTGAW